MSEESDNSPEELPAAEGAGPLCGERLAEARREQQITVLEVAKELHLDEPKVRALECNEFGVLGAPVFAKGHLRKYAQLVGVDEDDVFADYYAMTRAEAMPPIVAGRKKLRHEMSPGPWVAVIAVIVVAAAAYWWFALRDANSPAASSPTEESQPEQSQPEVLQPQQLQPEQLQPDEIDSTADDIEQPEDVVEQPEDVVEQPEEVTIKLATENSATAAADDVPQASADQLRVSLNFSGECWTEISDADGRRLFYNMGRDGQSVELSGKAPITALFGNADNVEVQVNNSAYSLPTPDSSNRTVRVAILNQ
jgi:cytoskeleton protein RodZ